MMKKFTNIAFLTYALVMVFACSATRTGSGISALNVQKNPDSEIPVNSVVRIDTFGLDIVPPSMGVQFYRDGIVFLSYSTYDDNMLSNHLSFGKPKAYFSNIYEGTLFKYADFSPTMPFPYPCDALTFSGDFRTMYFTKISNVDGKEKIFKASFTTENNFQTGWAADGFPLSFCTGDYIYSHPALSSDGNFMIVCSDRKDSYGGMDLYISSRDGNNWSDLRNMGTTVNSQSDEFYPFLDINNNLYFSSDKKGGCGGYDIYFCQYNGKGWYKPVALTNRINTPGDDIAFTLDRKNGTSAFYTTVESRGKSKPQLLRITLDENARKKSDMNLSSALFEMTGVHFEPATKTAYQIETQLASAENQPATEKIQEEKPAADKKNAGAPAAEKTDKTQAAVNTNAVASVPPESKTATAAQPASTIIYRVQILSGSKSKDSYTVTVNTRKFNTYEYLYKGAYRTTIGEFNTYKEALKLLNECHSTYPNAFVVVFRNNERVNDPSLLK